MKLCVIGAGAAGLCAAKYGSQFGYDVTVFEQTDRVGGIWAYTDDVGKDKHGLDVHSSMYQGLYTNLPKEIMGYPDFPFPEQEESYIPWEDVLKFYRLYADHFDLEKFIKFEHHVERVRPLMDETWEVKVQDMTTRKFDTIIFDAVLVCSGHYSAPNRPRLEGQDRFKGKQIHSHDYRNPETFRDETVLIVGAGPSGTDCVIEVAKVAKFVSWSHHASRPTVTHYGDNVDQKPDIASLRDNGVQFVDGSYQNYSVIIYCTGYTYTFPFLSVDCGISCIDNFVCPLYKQCVNISHPSMGFIGLPNYICPNQIFDLQVRFCLTFTSKREKLPTKEEMLEDTAKDIAERTNAGCFGRNKAHYLGTEFQQKYFTDLATTANIAPIKPVIAKIFAKGLCNLFHKSENFRSEAFKIVDDENFKIQNL